VLEFFYWVDDKYVAMSWLYFVLGAMFLYVHSRPFSMERLKAWWNAKPEPKPASKQKRQRGQLNWLGP
jgi:hypothetical protein